MVGPVARVEWRLVAERLDFGAQDELLWLYELW
jgi:hypothetical protein